MAESVSCVRILEYGVLTRNKGGLESYFYNQVLRMNPEHVKYSVILPVYNEKAAFEDELLHLGVKIHHVYRRWKDSPIGHILDISRFLSEHRKEYDIAVGNYLDFQNINFLVLAKLYGIPVRIAHSHQALSHRSRLVKLLVAINRFFAPAVITHLFACSEAAGRWMFGGLWQEKIKSIVLPNTIDAERFSYHPKLRKETRDKLEIPADTLVVGNISRIAFPKNHDMILNVFQKIVQKKEDSLLLLVGAMQDEAIWDRIHRFIKKHHLEAKVKYIGHRDDTNALLQAMDVFLFPSRYEGLGISLLEAQAAGLVCIAADKVIPPEVAVSGNLYFMPLEQSADDWATFILSKIPYQRASQAASIAAAGMDSGKQAGEIEALYLRLKHEASASKAS